MSQDSDVYIKGRGAQINPPNQFDHTHLDTSGLHWHDDDEIAAAKRTSYIETHPKSILNKVDSPDIGHYLSMNPYQGCEHGCIYCYARNTHTYWGYSAGIEFESNILVKRDAPALLERKIRSKRWEPQPIMFSGNTDCYQPAERTYKLTRQMLEVLWRYRHPTGLITKNALILRDIDLLQQMAAHQLVRVAISITTLDETLRQRLEPRTATGHKRIDLVRTLTDAGIPVSVMIAPIIPSMNDSEIHDIAARCADAGAQSINHTLIRLNGDVATIFKDWLRKNYPDRYDRVIHQIQDCHGGVLSDSRFGTRMRGEGHYAQMISQQMALVRQKYFADRSLPPYNTDLYYQMREPQLSFF